jgi:hypothetical protein
VTVLRNIWSDLVEKRLWPVALALVVALVAVPVALSRTSSAPEDVAAPPAATSAAATPKPGRAAVTLQTELAGPRKRSGAVHNPFKNPHPAKAATSTDATPSPSAGGDAPSGGATGGSDVSAPSSGGSGDGDGGSGHSTPKSEPDLLDTYHLTLRFGQAGHLKTIEDIARLAPLPSADNPFFVYLGVLEDGETAVFLISSDATATGDGKCKPSSKSCQTIEVKKGDTEFFDLTVGNEDVQYQMDVVKLERKGTGSTTARAAAVERHSNMGATLLRDAHVRGDGAFDGVDGYRWLPASGVLVRLPKQGAAKASADAADAAPDAGASAPIAGEPVWHWQSTVGA